MISVYINDIGQYRKSHQVQKYDFTWIPFRIIFFGSDL